MNNKRKFDKKFKSGSSASSGGIRFDKFQEFLVARDCCSEKYFKKMCILSGTTTCDRTKYKHIIFERK